MRIDRRNRNGTEKAPFLEGLLSGTKVKDLMHYTTARGTERTNILQTIANTYGVFIERRGACREPGEGNDELITPKTHFLGKSTHQQRMLAAICWRRYT